MTFDFSTLVTDRTQQDVAYVKQLVEKLVTGTATDKEKAEWNSFTLKGAYNHTDLNRVTAAMEALKLRLEGYGYAVPGYQRIKVPHVLPKPEPTSRLPEGYTELTYIESTGTQYIDTGFKPNQNTRLTMEVSFNTIIQCVPYGARHGALSNTFNMFLFGGSVRFDYGAEQKEIARSLTSSTKYQIDHNMASCAFGDSSATFSAQTFTCSYNLTLLAINTAGTISNYAKAKLYSCQIYDNGTLIRDYVPCINPSGVIGLYDLVTAAFFGNSGTGSFVAGESAEIDPVFANNTWENIIIACQKNEVPDTWAVGDNKNMTINGAEYQIDIIGKNHDTYADGSGVAPLTFQMHDCYTTGYKMNGSASNSGGWSSSYMRVTCLPTIFFPWLPAEVQSAIKEVNKRTSAGDKSTNIVTTADKLFLLSEIEIQGSCSYSAAGEGTQYEYYKAGNSKVKYTGGTSTAWWTRSPTTASVYSFCSVKADGGMDYVTANTITAVSFAFCFGGTSQINREDQIVKNKAVSVSSDSNEHNLYTWYEFDWPTPETMTLYLLNVAAIRAAIVVMKSTPSVPVDVSNFTMQEANDIEKILRDINLLLVNSLMSWYYSGDLFAGEV